MFFGLIAGVFAGIVPHSHGVVPGTVVSEHTVAAPAGHVVAGPASYAAVASPYPLSTFGHAPAYGYGYGVGNLGYGPGTAYASEYGLPAYGLNYGYGLGDLHNYAGLVRKKCKCFFHRSSLSSSITTSQRKIQENITTSRKENLINKKSMEPSERGIPPKEVKSGQRIVSLIVIAGYHNESCFLPDTRLFPGVHIVM